MICEVSARAMPLGLGNVVIPAAYGMDTTEAAMASVSHGGFILTIPPMFILLNLVLAL